MPAEARPAPWHKQYLTEFSTGLNEYTAKGNKRRTLRTTIGGQQVKYTSKQSGWRYQKPKSKKKVHLPNGQEGELFDNDMHDQNIGFAAHHFIEGDGLEEFQEIVDQAFPSENNNTYWETKGVGHISHLRYNAQYNMLWVSFAKGADVVYSKVPTAVAGTLFSLADKGDTRISSYTGKEGHALGIEFWNLVRIRGQLHGSQFPFEYYNYNTNSLNMDLSGRYVISDGRLKNYTMVADESNYAKLLDIKAKLDGGKGSYIEEYDKDPAGVGSDYDYGTDRDEYSDTGAIRKNMDKLSYVGGSLRPEDALNKREQALYNSYLDKYGALREYPMLTEQEAATYTRLKDKLLSVMSEHKRSIDEELAFLKTSPLVTEYALEMQQDPAWSLGGYLQSKGHNVMADLDAINNIRQSGLGGAEYSAAMKAVMRDVPSVVRAPFATLASNIVNYKGTDLGDYYDRFEAHSYLGGNKKASETGELADLTGRHMYTIYDNSRKGTPRDGSTTGATNKYKMTALDALNTPDMVHIMQEAQMRALRDFGYEPNKRKLFAGAGERFRDNPDRPVDVPITTKSYNDIMRKQYGFNAQKVLGDEYNEYIRLKRKINQYSINKYDKSGGAYNLMKYRGKPWKIQDLIDFGKAPGTPGHISIDDAKVYNALINKGMYQQALDHLKNTIPSYRKKRNAKNGSIETVYGNKPPYYAGYYDVIDYEDF
jgi:hypothetical protein